MGRSPRSVPAAYLCEEICFPQPVGEDCSALFGAQDFSGCVFTPRAAACFPAFAAGVEMGGALALATGGVPGWVVGVLALGAA